MDKNSFDNKVQLAWKIIYINHIILVFCPMLPYYVYIEKLKTLKYKTQHTIRT